MIFPLGVWGDVTSPPTDEPTLRGIRVERFKADGFNVHLREGQGEFEMWMQTEEGVQAYLETMTVAWPGGTAS